MKQYQYTLHFQAHSSVGMAEFVGEHYYFDHSEGSWHFIGDGGCELVASGSDVAYFTAEPLTIFAVASA